ncbi:MAG: ABC transporter permease [Thermoplasmata archaeon]|nr:ABC transporter permease [Thermoplasmata archaeon]MCI4354034.1 ABC transporter permease [Thermoplasmata archaeon]
MALHRVFAIARKSLGLLSHDRRTVAFVLVVPLILILVFGYGFGGNPTHIATAVVNSDQGPAGAAFLAALPAGVLDLHVVSSPQEAWAMVEHGDAWAAIILPANFSTGAAAHHAILTLALDGTSPTIVAAVLGALRSSAQQLVVAGGNNASLDLQTDYVYGSAGVSFLDTLAPGIMALTILFATTVLSIIVLVRERSGGLLERLFASPLTPGEFVAGHALSFGLVALAQSTVVIVATVGIFHAAFVGSLPLAYAVLVLFALGNLGLGMLLSAAARSEFQAIQFIPMLLFPQILFAGALFPLETIPLAFRPISNVLPLTYAGNAVHEVLLRGGGVGDVTLDIVALLLYAALTLGGATLAVRRQA